MRTDTWAETREAMRECAEHEVSIQRNLGGYGKGADNHPEKRIVQVDPQALIDLLDDAKPLRWTTEPPTGEGPYWVDDGMGYFIASWTPYDPEYFTTTSRSEAVHSCRRWAGPIPQPAD